MWAVTGNDITMTEGDFGVQLPIKINGATFSANDSVLFTLKTEMNGTTLLELPFTNIAQNTINLELTEAQSTALKTGTYIYSLDWYQNSLFLCNIIPSAIFRVVDKA